MKPASFTTSATCAGLFWPIQRIARRRTSSSNPGEQDLTAHVNFTALDLWGRRAGLERTGCVSQMAFLVALGRANEFADLYDPGASEVERIRARLLLKTLIHPEGMGETFQVFIQHKDVAPAASHRPGGNLRDCLRIES